MKNSKMFFMLLISCLVISTITIPQANSCAVMTYEVVRQNELVPTDITFFNSGLGTDLFLKPYLFVTHPEAENGADNYHGNTDIDREVNLKEWVAFLNAKVKANDLDEVIYTMDKAPLQGLYRQLSSNKATVNQTNPALNYLVQNRRSDVLEYLIYAKNCENFAYYSEWSWDYTAELKKRRDPQKMQQLINEGLIKYRQATAQFLKLRYAYQIIRLANYAGKYQQCIAYYEQLIPALKVDSVYFYHALRHKAGAQLRNKQETDFFINTAIIFDQCPQLMDHALYEDFYLPQPKLWEQTLKATQNKHRRATLWLMRALRERKRIDLQPLEEMYRLEPKSSRLEFLLVYQINKIEKALLRSEFFFPDAIKDPAVTSYIKDLQNFVAAVDQSLVRRPALWSLAAGYLNVLLKNYPEAERDLAAAEKGPGVSPLITEEIRLVRTVAALAQAKVMNAKLEEQCLPSLSRLANLKSQYNQTMIYRSLLILIAQKYFNANEMEQGYSCIAKTGYENLSSWYLMTYCNEAALQKIITYLTGAATSPFEQFLRQGHVYTVADLYYIKGSKYLNAENYSLALAAFEKVAGKFEREIGTSFKVNYYNNRTGLYNYPNNEDRSFPKMTKYEFIKTVNELLDTAKNHPEKAALSYYQIANGFFHTISWSYLYGPGKYGPYFDYSDQHPQYPFYNPAITARINSTINDWTALTREVAWKYYDKAMRTAQDRELAAQCCFLAAAAQTKFSHFEEFEPKGQGKAYYYELLKNKYTDTKYYQKVLKECADFQDYLGKKNK